ncbi:phage tail tip lysozyme [Achromobacter xylosoxidans]|uniref:phage tail tip lysozyme n=1 Tax=Alcaligenes xylosoxydans xylosoxydans TaxID=85698 RepID=UPI00203E8E50|nr:phage tail tip lysozyme [Achromobacter xylosoxidans]MCM2574572.1 phage tail tip lysozyme [Achromobacter xylosoxidans]
MATVIDALVVTLGLDAKAFKRGAAETDESLKHTRDESARTARDMEARGKQAAMFFSKVRNEALALLAVFTAGMGIKNFVSSTVESTASLARLSGNLNMSAKDLAEWQLAAKNAGGSVEGITNQLKESADQVAKFKRGMAAETLPAFFQFGGKVEDLKDGNTYLQARARIVADLYKTDRSRAALAANMMGLDAQQFNLYKEGPEGIARRRREQSGAAGELAAASDRAEQLRQRYDTAMNKLSSVGVNVLTAMMPAFDFLVEKLIELGDWIIRNRGAINDGVKSFISGFEQLLKALTSLIEKLVPKEVRDKIGSSSDPVKASMDAAKDALTPDWLKSKPKAELTPDAKDAIEKFEKMGWSRSQAIGIVNNLQAESGGKLDHRAVGDSGTAFGVAQWRNERVEMFKRVMGVDIMNATRDQQYAFVDWELRNTHKGAGDRLRASKSVEDASRIVTTDFEIPAKKEIRADERAAVATELARLAQADALKNSALGAVNMVQAAQAAPLAAQASAKPFPLNTENNHEINIHGDVNVHTPATDGRGIARELGALGGSQNLVNQANTGTF